MMANNLHVMFDSVLLIKWKRSFLLIQESVLKINQRIDRYLKLRNIELLEKKALFRVLKELKERIESLESNLPRLPKEKVVEEKEAKIKRTSDLELELENIRAKLAALEAG
ncbi:MAG: hypothetical protein QXO70_01685 [Candidatus Pacearchaeota archaeon]